MYLSWTLPVPSTGQKTQAVAISDLCQPGPLTSAMFGVSRSCKLVVENFFLFYLFSQYLGQGLVSKEKFEPTDEIY